MHGNGHAGGRGAYRVDLAFVVGSAEFAVAGILVCFSRRAFDGFDARDIAYENNRLTWSIHRKDEQAARGDPFIVRRAIREGVE